MSESVAVQWRAESRPCALCGSWDARTLGLRGGHAHRRRLGVETTVVRCRRCTLTYTRPTLFPLSNPYAAEDVDVYFVHTSAEPARLRGQEYADIATALIGRAGRMLEVGCGLGYFLDGARDRGWEPRGIDFTPAFVERARARGLDVDCAGPLESSYLEDAYDCVLLLNILEHLYEPRQVLERVFKALRPGGVVAIGVPNEAGLTSRVGNLYNRVRGRDWATNLSPTFPPFHVVGFSPKSLRYVLEDIGFAVERLVSVGGSNAMEAPGSIIGKLESAALTGTLAVASAIGQGDAIDCWARRPS